MRHTRRVTRCLLLFVVVVMGMLVVMIPMAKSEETVEASTSDTAPEDTETAAESTDTDTSNSATDTDMADDASPLPQEEETETTSPETDASPPLPNEEEQQEEKEPEPEPKRKEEPFDAFNFKEHMDWGTYYDPQNVFCGMFDCYKILGFDYESFGRKHPDRKVITKRYRSLSREWHPDKSKHKDAKERFVKIARAYEVLTDDKVRAEYDYMRYNQEAYFQKHGASVLWSYAPKTDASFIALVLLLLANWFTWIAQKVRWQNVADRLTKAAVEDWSPSMGGTAESKQLREEAMKLLAERQQQKEEEEKAAAAAATESNNKATGTATTPKKASKKSKEKISGKDKKRLEQEQLTPIIRELVHEIKDFGAGFHQPTWKDLFIVRLAKFPYFLTTGTLWQSKYYLRRLQKKELNDEERRVLTERAVGNVTWELASEEDRDTLVTKELWIMDNLVEWKEEEEVKTWSRAEQKYYQKMKKKGGVPAGGKGEKDL